MNEALVLMSEEQLKAFIAKVQGDTSLQEKLKAASDADAVVSIAKEEGFSISAEDLKNARAEISDEELESVAGGFGTNWETCGGAKYGTGCGTCRSAGCR